VQAPNRRIHSVKLTISAAAVRGTLNSWVMGTSSSRKMVKSNASGVQPSQPATPASHWSLVGSRHQAIRVSTPVGPIRHLRSTRDEPGAHAS
jgi:hypothetical protein